MVLSFDRARTTDEDLATVRAVAQKFPGARRLEFHFTDAQGNCLRLRASQRKYYRPYRRSRATPRPVAGEVDARLALSSFPS